MAETQKRNWLIWTIGLIGLGVIAAMVIIKIWFAASVFMPGDSADEAAALAEPLDATEQVARDMVTSASQGTPVMPTNLAVLNPEDYSRELARFIPLETGMPRFVATDELLIYYNGEAGSGVKVSSNERSVDGDVIYVIRRSGLADDALSAEETFARFENDVLVDFGTRIQCRRGPNANQWTTELCP